MQRFRFKVSTVIDSFGTSCQGPHADINFHDFTYYPLFVCAVLVGLTLVSISDII